MGISKTIAALVGAACIVTGGIAAAAPAMATPTPEPTRIFEPVEGMETQAAKRVSVRNASINSAGTIGIGRLNGGTFNLYKWDTQYADGYPAGDSFRSVKTGAGWCIYERAVYHKPGAYLTSNMSTVHRYTTANGGYRTLLLARLMQSGQAVDGMSQLSLRSC